MHIFNMLITSVKSFKLIACKPWEELITQTCYPTLKAKLKIVLSRKCPNFVKIFFSSAKIQIHIFNIFTTSMQSFKMIR